MSVRTYSGKRLRCLVPVTQPATACLWPAITAKVVIYYYCILPVLPDIRLSNVTVSNNWLQSDHNCVLQEEEYSWTHALEVSVIDWLKLFMFTSLSWPNDGLVIPSFFIVHTNGVDLTHSQCKILVQILLTLQHLVQHCVRSAAAPHSEPWWVCFRHVCYSPGPSLRLFYFQITMCTKHWNPYLFMTL